MLKVKRILLEDTDNNVILYVETDHNGKPRYDIFRDNLASGVNNFATTDNSLDIAQQIGKVAYPKGIGSETLCLIANTVATFLDDNGHDEMCETDR